MAPQKRLSVMVLDDGELDDVQNLLEEMGIEFGRVRGGAIVPDAPPPRHLLISTPRRMKAVRAYRPDLDGEHEPMRIVVVEGDSVTLRSKLREVGFDYIVRRPVHPEALRLLVLRCLYTGEERRREPRVPVGYDVSFRAGLIQRRATLADLSFSGARLFTTYSLSVGKRVKVRIPEAVGASQPLVLSGRITRRHFDENLGENGLHVAAVLFDSLTPEERRELEWVIEARGRGPVSLVETEGVVTDPRVEGTDGVMTERRRNVRSDPRVEPDRPRAAEAEIPEIPLEEPAFEEPPEELRGMELEVDVRLERDEEAADPLGETAPDLRAQAKASAQESEDAEADGEADAGTDPDDRRREERRTFSRKVPGFANRALRVLVGRDLTTQGMRVERYPGLEIGDRLQLAIYGDAEDSEPFLVWANVVRDDGERGLALTFDPLREDVKERLEALVGSLPSVESLHDGECGAMGTVLGEIL